MYQVGYVNPKGNPYFIQLTTGDGVLIQEFLSTLDGIVAAHRVCDQLNAAAADVDWFKRVMESSDAPGREQ